MDISSGITTILNVVLSGSDNTALASSICFLVSSNSLLDCKSSAASINGMIFFNAFAAVPNFALAFINFPTQESMISGNESNLNVWPVGAVSNTTTSYSLEVITDKNTSNAAASSAPGEAEAKSICSPKKSRPINWSGLATDFWLSNALCFSSIALSGSISTAKRFSLI